MPPSARPIRPALLRQMNERAIFQYIRANGPATRAQLTRRLGMSAPAASRAVAHLLKAALIEAAEPRKSSSAGRPGAWYALAGQKRYVLGATIGLQHCSVVATGLDGQYDPASVITFATPDTYAKLIADLASAVRQIGAQRNATGKSAPLGIGISVPGQIDRHSRTVMMSPNLHLLDGKALERDLTRRLKIRCVMFHETDCACLAEQSFGVARGLQDYALISLYEGFGVSAVCGGRLLTGNQGLAGEIGHCTVDPAGKTCGCGNVGCLETVATDAAFAADISHRLGRKLSIEEILQTTREGKLDPTPELDLALKFLSLGIGIIINALNPQAVLLCSRMLDLQGIPTLRERVARHTLAPLLKNCQIIRAQGNTLKGAIACIIQHVVNTLGPTMD